ncbi:MAG TPA: YhjD/YihY/BrkB family envelope integrity protein, partial [Pseudonocardiaceae bacterium]|nr:YhjD/YihY/BrkB family envelope integrity protein [Pseudonocardiaceae bacterium]
MPLLMVRLSVAGFVLSGQPRLLGQLRATINGAVPPSLTPLTGAVIEGLVEHRFGLGVAGVAVAGYCGWSWINALREAVTGMWRLERPHVPIIATVVKDYLALLGLAVALLVSFTLTAAGGSLTPLLLHVAGLADTGPPRAALVIASVAGATLANWLVWAWVLAKLPRDPLPLRAARDPALAVALGFEVLKHATNLYLQTLAGSPTGATFGSLVGLLVFVYLVARLVLLGAAWMATTHPAPPRPPPAPGLDPPPHMTHRRCPRPLTRWCARSRWPPATWTGRWSWGPPRRGRAPGSRRGPRCAHHRYC